MSIPRIFDVPGRRVELDGEFYFIPAGHTCWVGGHDWVIVKPVALVLEGMRRSVNRGAAGSGKALVDYVADLNSGVAPGIVCAQCGITAWDYELYRKRGLGVACVRNGERVQAQIRALGLDYFGKSSLEFR